MSSSALTHPFFAAPAAPALLTLLRSNRLALLSVDLWLTVLSTDSIDGCLFKLPSACCSCVCRRPLTLLALSAAASAPHNNPSTLMPALADS